VVGGCSAVLAIIGPRWTDARNAAGQRRLDDPDDIRTRWMSGSCR
jgi:hypothetical protein